MDEKLSEPAPAASRMRRPLAIDVLLLLAIAAGLVAGQLAFVREHGADPVWWDGEGYRALERGARGIDRAVFLSDVIDGTTNTRLHSCQYAIIPGVLDTEFDWPTIFARLDAGDFLICDFSDSRRLDQEIDNFRDWAAREKREVTVDRMSRQLAVLRAGERP